MSVAVVGASERASFASSVLRTLMARGLEGGVHVVNPTHESVFGLKTVARPEDLADAVDCAVIGVNGRLAVDVLRSCAERGVRSALIHASGFAEGSSADGGRLQDEIGEIATEYGIRVCGPNVLGMLNFKDRILLGGGQAEDLPAGNVGVVSQSGGLGIYLTQAQAEGVRLFSHCLCAGNSADIDVFDFANYLLAEDDVKAVVICLEGIRSMDRMLDLGETSKRLGKPVLVFKAGRGESGARAALSHTGSIAGAYAAVQAAFRRAGLIEVSAYEDIVETAVYFSRAKAPKTRAVGVVTGMGGCAVMMCDTAEAARVALPMPSEESLVALLGTVPEYGVLGNPADLTANPGGADKFESAFRIFANDPTYDTVVFPLAPSPALAEDRPGAVCRVAADSEATVLVYWLSRWLEGPGTGRLFADRNVSVFRSARLLFESVSRWHQWNDELAAVVREPVDSVVREAVLAAVDLVLGTSKVQTGGTALSETVSREVCEAAGLPLVPASLVTTADHAVQEAGRLGYPVAVKAISTDVVHKSEAGAVRLAVSGSEAVRQAYADVIGSVRLHSPSAIVEGVLVAPMVEMGVEAIVGARRDPLVGPVVVCGLGGTVVEALGAPVMELAPVSAARARDMVARMPGGRLLGEYRGRTARDQDALERAIVQVSQMIAADPRIHEVDLNPIMVLAKGEGVVALDALVVVDEGPNGKDRR